MWRVFLSFASTNFPLYIFVVITTGTQKHLVHREQLPPDLAGQVSDILPACFQPEGFSHVVGEMSQLVRERVIELCRA